MGVGSIAFECCHMRPSVPGASPRKGFQSGKAAPPGAVDSTRNMECED